MPENKLDTINSYIKSKPKEIQDKLTEMRQIIRDALPDTDEAIKWGEPAILDKDGMILVIFAGYKQHMNLVTTPSTKQAFENELTDYKTGKGSVQLSYDKQLPSELIKEIVTHRLDEYRNHGVKWM